MGPDDVGQFYPARCRISAMRMGGHGALETRGVRACQCRM
jgi:hypothetical protein